MTPPLTSNIIFNYRLYFRMNTNIFHFLQHNFFLIVQQLPALAKMGATPQGQRRHPFESCLVGLRTLSRIFYSLNWQDLPEYFEDHIKEWMSLFSTLMSPSFNVEQCPQLASMTTDDEPSAIEQLQSGVVRRILLL